MTITRSTGTLLPGSALVAGGGYRGCSEELDAVVRLAASLLADAYGSDIEIRYNSDRESGGAWLKTPDGYSAHVGICADQVTARRRASWESMARESEAMAQTALSDWDGHDMGEAGKAACAEDAVYWRDALARNPEGLLTVCAHITERAAGTGAAGTGAAGVRVFQLARLPGWHAHYGPSKSGGYHHGLALSAYEALARCLYFVPPS